MGKPQNINLEQAKKKKKYTGTIQEIEGTDLAFRI